MYWPYTLVFAGTLLVDIVPIPLPPAFTVMIFLQIEFDLNIWAVIVIGVIGSVLGRYILTLYIPSLSERIFSKDKNEEVRLLGKRMNHNKWKRRSFILVYSLMPLPTTPLFIAGGMAKMKPMQILPFFTIGKLVSDAIAVIMGKFAAENTGELLSGLISAKTISGFIIGLLLVFAIFYVDWNKLLLEKRLTLKFNIWK